MVNVHWFVELEGTASKYQVGGFARISLGGAYFPRHRVILFVTIMTIMRNLCEFWNGCAIGLIEEYLPRFADTEST